MGKSFLEMLFSVKNFRNVNNILKPNAQKKLVPKKGKIIIKRKITHKPCNTNPKAKPIDN